jgi:hypothetical protein
VIGPADKGRKGPIYFWYVSGHKNSFVFKAVLKKIRISESLNVLFQVIPSHRVQDKVENCVSNGSNARVGSREPTNHWEIVEVVETHATLTALKAVDIVWW